MPATQLSIVSIEGFPTVRPGDDLPGLIVAGLEAAQWDLRSGDVVCVSSKVVSKAENRFVDLNTVRVSSEARELAERTRKDPRLVELVLQESELVSRAVPHVLIVKHRLGFVCANAGIDQSNLGEEHPTHVLLLPHDPDASARQIASTIFHLTRKQPAVVIMDTHGRPFRLGNVNVAIGISGMPALLDQRGQTDRYGRILQNTVTAVADQVAAAAGLVTGEAAEGRPVVLMRGLNWAGFPLGHSSDLIRDAAEDLYVNP